MPNSLSQFCQKIIHILYDLNTLLSVLMFLLTTFDPKWTNTKVVNSCLCRLSTVTSHVDYCNSVLSSALEKVTDKLQHIQNAAARLVTGAWKYECGLSQLMHNDLHWLVIPQRVQYKLAVTVHRCFRHRAPRYLADYCVPVSEVAGRQHLRSARCHQLSVPRVRCSTFGTRAFSVAGPGVWNSLPDHL